MIKNWLLGSIVSLAISTPFASFATTLLVEGVPTTWRLQRSPGTPVFVFFTGTTCGNLTNGGLQLPPTATSDENNEFWSLVMTAKTTGAPIGVYYDNVTCYIQSFYMKP